MKFGHMFSYVLLSVLILSGTSSCGNNSSSDSDANTDTTAAASSADTAAADQIVQDYMVVADSLGTIFDGLNSVDDVVATQGEIRRLSAALQDFNTKTVQVGMLIGERMAALGADKSASRLIDARRRLDSLEGVAPAVNAVENGKELSRKDEADTKGE